MPRKKRTISKLQFSDCFDIMDKALMNGGLRVPFATAGSAVRFRQRCYKARTLMREAAHEVTPAGQPPTTPYDDIFIRREHETKPSGLDSVLLFELHSLQPLPEVTTLDGKAIILEPGLDDFEGLSLDLDLGDEE